MSEKSPTNNAERRHKSPEETAAQITRIAEKLRLRAAEVDRGLDNKQMDTDVYDDVFTVYTSPILNRDLSIPSSDMTASNSGVVLRKSLNELRAGAHIDDSRDKLDKSVQIHVNEGAVSGLYDVSTHTGLRDDRRNHSTKLDHAQVRSASANILGATRAAIVREKQAIKSEIDEFIRL